MSNSITYHVSLHSTPFFQIHNMPSSQGSSTKSINGSVSGYTPLTIPLRSHWKLTFLSTDPISTKSSKIMHRTTKHYPHSVLKTSSTTKISIRLRLSHGFVQTRLQQRRRWRQSFEISTEYLIPISKCGDVGNSHRYLGLGSGG